MGGWAQAAVAAIVAFASGLGWTAWLGSWVGVVDHRLVVVERFANGHDDKWTAAIHGVESRLANVERDSGRTYSEIPLRMQGLEKRVEVAEGLFQRFVDVAPIIRDSNDLQREQIRLFHEALKNDKPKR